jgi:glucose-1-phosphate thymidylyltransferase
VQGVVFAAGEGTRMRPLTEDRPKGLVEVAGQPLLAWAFDALAEAGVDELVVVVGYRAGDVIDHFGDAYEGLPIVYAHQRERTGLADALLRATPHLSEDFIAINGDNVCRANLAALRERHLRTGADATLLLEEVSTERARTGAVCELTDDGTIEGLVEKPEDPPSTLIPRGVYALSPIIAHACHLVTGGAEGERQLADAIDLLMAAGRRVETVPMQEWCVNVNTPADRDRVTERLGED